jgi:DNA-binding winged helix-turn-helix (wHTH) protein
MQDKTISASDTLKTGNRTVIYGIAAIVVIRIVTAFVLFRTLPDANAFNDRVERIFIENQLTGRAEITLLEILAQSGSAFSETLTSYRIVIFVLLIFATALLIATLGFLVTLLILNRRLQEIDRQGIQVASLLISRAEKVVVLNDMEFKLTDAAIETISVLAEARMDGDILSGAELEAVIQGRDASACEEAAGATRIKRLRDSLGNQMVAEILVKNIARQGYVLSIDKDVIKMI